MLWEFMNDKNAAETDQKISRVYGQGVITDRHVRKRFLKIRIGDTSSRDEPGRSSDFNRELVECNPRKSAWE